MSILGIEVFLMEKNPIGFSEAKNLLVRQILSLESDFDYESGFDSARSVSVLAQLCLACSSEFKTVCGKDMETLFLETYNKIYKRELGYNSEEMSIPDCMLMETTFPRSVVKKVASLIAKKDVMEIKEWGERPGKKI